jgi:excisionase family DNA binding protein
VSAPTRAQGADPELLLSPEEAARRLAVSRTRVFELVQRGELRSLKVGRLRRIVARSLDEFVDREAN